MNPPLGVVQGTLDLLVLRTLGAAAPMHGFAILDWIRATTEDDLVVEDGALYPALRRMENRGWLESKWGISEKGRRARYYQMTPLGEKALAIEDARWERYVEAVAKLSGQGEWGGEAGDAKA
jgi:PadR family transcriptional regulator PadR